jgi:mannitol/fructose-specific phosphotransferase system IIA component (Ntr-type)
MALLMFESIFDLRLFNQKKNRIFETWQKLIKQFNETVKEAQYSHPYFLQDFVIAEARSNVKATL